jgi:hypothetical protein
MPMRSKLEAEPRLFSRSSGNRAWKIDSESDRWALAMSATCCRDLTWEYASTTRSARIIDASTPMLATPAKPKMVNTSAAPARM